MGLVKERKESENYKIKILAHSGIKPTTFTFKYILYMVRSSRGFGHEFHMKIII